MNSRCDFAIVAGSRLYTTRVPSGDQRAEPMSSSGPPPTSRVSWPVATSRTTSLPAGIRLPAHEDRRPRRAAGTRGRRRSHCSRCPRRFAAVASNSQIASSSITELAAAWPTIRAATWSPAPIRTASVHPGSGVAVTTAGRGRRRRRPRCRRRGRRRSRRSPAERDVRAVRREHGLGVDLRAGARSRAVSPDIGSRGVDVPVGGIREQAVARRARTAAGRWSGASR